MGDLKRLRGGAVWVILVIAVITLWFFVVNGDSSTQTKDFSTVVEEIKNGQVSKLEMSSGSDKVKVLYKDDGVRDARTILPPDISIVEALDRYGVPPDSVAIQVKAASRWGSWISAFTFILPTLFLIGIFVFMMRQAQGSNNQAISFGKSRARLFTGN